MLNAAIPSRALRQIIAPSSASAIANFQTAGLRCGTRTPTMPSLRYRSVKASLKTALSDAISRTLTRSGLSATHACRQLRANAIRRPPPPGTQRFPQSCAPGDHLGDRQPQHQIGEVLLAARQHRLWNAVLENDDVVLIVQLELGVPRIGQLTKKCARELRKLRTQLEIEVGAQIGERSIQLVVEPPIANQGLQLRSALLELLGRFLSGSERGRGTRHLLLRPGSRDL